MTTKCYKTNGKLVVICELFLFLNLIIMCLCAHANSPFHNDNPIYFYSLHLPLSRHLLISLLFAYMENWRHLEYYPKDFTEEIMFSSSSIHLQ